MEPEGSGSRKIDIVFVIYDSIYSLRRLASRRLTLDFITIDKSVLVSASPCS